MGHSHGPDGRDAHSCDGGSRRAVKINALSTTRRQMRLIDDDLQIRWRRQRHPAAGVEVHAVAVDTGPAFSE